MLKDIPALSEHSLCSHVTEKEMLLIFGGFNKELILNEKLFSLNLNKWNWKVLETTGDKPTPRKSHGAAIINNKMYVFGGFGSDCIKGTHLNDLYVLDLEKWVWTKHELENPPSPREVKKFFGLIFF